MAWLAYALICAFFASAAGIVQKKTLIRQHAMEFSASLAVLNLLLSLPLFFFIDFSGISINIIVGIFFLTLFGATGFLLIAKSIRHMEISAASPLLVMGPGISAVLAFFILGEKLTFFQAGGIAVLIMGSYILELEDYHNLLHPIRTIKQSKYFYFILIALLLYSVSAVGDRMMLSTFGIAPITYLAIVHVFLAFHFLVMITLFHDGIRGIRNGIRNAQPWLLLVAVLTVSYRYAQISAVKVAYVGLVLPIKRMSAFFTTIVGGELFHEKNLLRKGFACLVMIAGVVMIVL